MSMQHNLRRLLYSIRRTIGVRDPWQTVLYAMERARGAAGYGKYALEPQQVEHPFDSQYDVKTSGLIASHPGDTARYAYYGVSPSVFRRACRLWQSTLPPEAKLEGFTFIDLGAGMGRALLLASELPFHKVIGVEVDSELVHIARQNIASWAAAGRARSPIEMIEEDVLNFTFPDGPLLIFLYNPFAEEILQRILDQLRSPLEAAPIDVLYIHPVFGFLFGSANFQQLWFKLIPLDSSDADADAFRSTSETCVAYRRRPGRR